MATNDGESAPAGGTLSLAQAGGTLSTAGEPDTTPRSRPPEDLTRDPLLAQAPRVDYRGAKRPALGGIPLLVKLGQGGMGAVYYGFHTMLDAEVAVKVLPLHLLSQNPEIAKRFVREAQIAASINCPNLIYVRDVGQDGGYFYQVMEYVHGVSAGGYLKHFVAKTGRTGLPETEALEICIAAAKGLAAAHAQNTIHRDVKPDNILIPRARDKAKLLFPDAKLADLGLARTERIERATEVPMPQTPGREGPSLTGAGAAMGTLGYMPSEQIDDARSAGKPADVFALGATLYALLAGHAPFCGESAMERRIATILDKKEPIAKLRPDVSQATAMLIESCLQKDPARRYPDATVLLAALQKCLEPLKAQAAPADDLSLQPVTQQAEALAPTVVQRGPPALAPVVRPQRRTRPPAPARKMPLVAGVAMVGLVAAGLVFLFGNKTPVDAPPLGTSKTEASATPEPAKAAPKGQDPKPAARPPAEETRLKEAAEKFEAERQALAAAREARKNGDWPQVAVLLEKALQSAPAANTPERREADALLKTARTEVRKRADFAARLKEADAHLAAKRFTAATHAYGAAKRIWPDSPDIGKVDEGLKQVESAAPEDPYDAAMKEGQEKLAAADLDGAESAFRTALQAPGHDDDAPAKKGLEDIKTARALIVKPPDDAAIHPRVEANTNDRREPLQLVGHTGAVTSADWSPDGTRILTTSADGTARVWDAETGRLLFSWGGTGKTYVNCVQWSPDGKGIVTASGDDAQIWDAQSGRKIQQFGQRTNIVGLTIQNAQWSPDGKWIVTASNDCTARVWDAQTGKELRTFKGHRAGASFAQWSPDGKRIVTASEDATTRVWDVQSGRELHCLKGHTGRVRSAQWSPDGKRIATAASEDNMARVWDAESGRELYQLTGHKGKVRSVQWSPDGKRIATAASEDNTAWVWDAENGRELRQLPHPGWVFSAQWSPDGKRIATASFHHPLLVWDAEDGRELRRLAGHTESFVESVAWSPDGTRIVSASRDKTARIWYAGPASNTNAAQPGSAPPTAGTLPPNSEARSSAEYATRANLPATTFLRLAAYVTLDVVLVPPGKFTMGSPAAEKDRGASETPHEVTLTKPFYMSKFEVSQEHYRAVMGSNPSQTKGDKNPVDTVSWDDAQEFCRRLTKKAGMAVHLPTEAEWEYACRAGTTTRFCSGDADGDLNSVGWCAGNSERATHPGGQRQPNAWGLYDMHGNVPEWCLDWDGPYAAEPVTDPQGPPTGKAHVMRGGGWLASPGLCRSASRLPGGQTGVGFRVLVVAAPDTPRPPATEKPPPPQPPAAAPAAVPPPPALSEKEEAKKGTRVKSVDGKISLSVPEGWQQQRAEDANSLLVVLPQKARVTVSVMQGKAGQNADGLAQIMYLMLKGELANKKVVPDETTTTILDTKARGLRFMKIDAGVQMVYQTYMVGKDQNAYTLSYLVGKDLYTTEKEGLEAVISSLQVH